MFNFPLTVHEGEFAGEINAPAVNSIPLNPSDDVGAVILTEADGSRPAGMYLFDGTRYRFCIPDLDISKAIIYGYTINLYYGLTSDVTVTADKVYRNGVLFNSNVLTRGTSIYGVIKYNGGGGGAGVSSLNQQTGDVQLTGISGISVSTQPGGVIQIEPGVLDEGIF